MPKEIIGVLYLKKSCCYANCDLGVLPIENAMQLQPFVMKY
jgi:hypothetical protein